MSEPVPLICDMPPGGILIFTLPEGLKAKKRDILLHQWALLAERIRSGEAPSVIVLEEGVTVRWLQPNGAWPDAEHCAA